MKTVIFPGTFDPITHGHSDLALRACTLFDKVIIAVAKNPGKKPLLTFEERIELCKRVTELMPQITVQGFSGLLVDFAREHNATGIIRSLRGSSDLDHELQLAYMNQQLDDKIQTIFLAPRPEYAFISSSLLREITTLGGDISPFAHQDVVNRLKTLCR
jgi:pantetheine-phosphate adenylyltransferase